MTDYRHPGQMQPSAQHPQYVVYQQVVKPPTNGQAVTSLILGIVSAAIGVWSPVPVLGLFAAFLSLLPAVLAVVFGHTGLRESGRSGIGRGQAVTGMALGYVALGIIAFTTLFWIFAMVLGSMD